MRRSALFFSPKQQVVCSDDVNVLGLRMLRAMCRPAGGGGGGQDTGPSVSTPLAAKFSAMFAS